MKSMTGYGTHNSSSKWSDCELSIKCVNGRFLELRCHLPKELSSLEPKLRKSLQSIVKRGAVDIGIVRRPRPETMVSRVEIKSQLAKQWVTSFKELQRDLNVKIAVPVDVMLRSTDILHVEEHFPLTSGEEKEILLAFAKALVKLERARVLEGQALKHDLAKQLKQLQSLVLSLGGKIKSSRMTLQQRVLERYAVLKSDLDLDDKRIAAEIALLVERGDVNEELVRLRQHISAIGQLLKSKTPVGKRLDFFMQELLREVNTIGSKSQLASVTGLVVECKSVIERLREQVQNIE